MEASFSAAVFTAMAAAMLGPGGRPDAVLYIGAQPAVAMMARIVAALARRPYFVNVNDLAAHAALDVGIVGSRLHKALEAFEFAAYAERRGHRALPQLRGGAGHARVPARSYPHDSKPHRYRRHPARPARRPVPRPIRNPEQAFVVMHAGSMGRKQGLMNVVSAARPRRAPGCAGCSWATAKRGTNWKPRPGPPISAICVRYVPFQPDDMLSEMFAAADVLLVNQLQ